MTSNKFLQCLLVCSRSLDDLIEKRKSFEENDTVEEDDIQTVDLEIVSAELNNAISHLNISSLNK